MSKLETLKKAFQDQGMIEMLPRLAYNSWCALELGRSYYPSIDMLDDLYTGFVSGVLANLGSGKTPVYLEQDEIGVGPEKRFTAEGYMKLWYSLTELGSQTYPYDEWVKENSESEKWAEWIEEAILKENAYKLNPEKWLVEFRESLVRKRIK
jgi:hypothetical protein